MGAAKVKKEKAKTTEAPPRKLTNAEKEQLRLAAAMYGSMSELMAVKALDLENVIRLGRMEEEKDLFMWSTEGRDPLRKWLCRLMLTFSFRPAPKILRPGTK